MSEKSNLRTTDQPKKMIGEPWFPGLTLKTLVNWDLYWNKCTLYIKIEALLKQYYMYMVWGQLT
jgi:hypothetical protein